MRSIILLFLSCFSSWCQVVTGNATSANVGTLQYQPPPPPPSAPVISSVSSNTPGTNYANITWTTDVTTTNDSVYFDSSSTYSWESNTVAGGTSHSIWLSNLTEAATYQFKVASWGSSGLSATSSPSSFVTASTYVPFTGFTNDFSSGMNGLSGTKWGVSGGYLTNNTGLGYQLINDTNFSASTNWTIVGNITVTNNSVVFSNAVSTANVSDTASSRWFYSGGYWDRFSLAISNTNPNGVFISTFADFNPDDASVTDYYRSNGTLTAWFYLPTRSYRKNAIGCYEGDPPPDPPIINGAITNFSHWQAVASEVNCLTNISATNNVSVTVKISELPSNGIAGMVLRQSPLQHVIAIGDSKTPYWGWPYYLQRPLLSGEDNIYESGASLARIWQLITNGIGHPSSIGISSHTQPIDIALINASVNELDSGDPTTQRATQLTYLTNIVRCLQTNYPLIQCYLASVCASNRSNTNINMAIDTCITNNASFCFHGIDERVWFGDATAWALYSDGDGIHYNYNTTGLVYAASQWNTVVRPNTNSGSANSQMDGIYVYYSDTDKAVFTRAINFGTNTMMRGTAKTWVSNATFTASIYTNKVKVFYNGSIVGAHDHLNSANTLQLTNVGVGVFATEPQTKFSYLSVIPSTDSDTVP